MAEPTLSWLIDQLPELYHPIFGVPEVVSSRQIHEARVDLLLEHVALLSRHLGRTLRILDLGSAQGYLTFRMAEIGHHVTGIDSLPINVAVSRAVRDLHPELDVTFEEGDIVDMVKSLEAGVFDVVVGFSVLHHIVDRDGKQAGVRLATKLASRVPHGFFEMALSSEPVYWAQSLPPDPRATLTGYPFIRQIGNSTNHLSDIERPIFFSSRSLALVNGEFHSIVSFADKPHSAGDNLEGIRRYYTLPTGIVKMVARYGSGLADEVITERRLELRREAHALGALKRAGLEAPDLIEFSETNTETLLARTMYPGGLLSEAVAVLSDGERTLVTRQVLGQLAGLEEHGLYHGDLRLWNVIWDRESGEARVIDHGSIRSSADDAMWPFDARFSLLVFLGALWRRQSDQTGLEIPRSSRLDSGELGHDAAALVSALLVHAADDTVFRDLRAAWQRIEARADAGIWPPIPLAWEWLTKVEEQRDEMRTNLVAHIDELQRVSEARAASEEDRVELDRESAARELHLRSQLAERYADLERQEAAYRAERKAEIDRREILHRRELAERDFELAQRQAERDQLSADLRLIYSSRTWRAMAVVRRLRSAKQKFLP